ncbi:hypothetical protein CSA57_12830 [candidate division KSB3 bacterium]|nr:MAG: hypothetical protein CSA57_12830 [candidate division KSB3 bacterium]
MHVGTTIQKFFGLLPDEAQLAQAPPAERAFTNLHIHLPPNFGSIRSIEEAIQHAAAEKIVVLGSSNYYDHSIYTPFAEAALQAGIVPVFGIEVLTMDEELRDAGTLVNDPKNPGKFYLCGKGLTAFDAIDEDALPIWNTIRQGDRCRIEAMIAALNAVETLQDRNICLRYDAVAQKIAEEKQLPAATVFLQERHLAQALQSAIFECVTPAERRKFLQRLYQTEGEFETEQLVTVQNELRTHLLKQGKAAYVEEAYISPDEAARLIAGLGGYVSYPILIDGAATISPFEGPPEALVEHLLERQIGAVEFIPTRNDIAILSGYVKVLLDEGFVIGSGTEHNDAVWLPLLPACRQKTPLTPELLEVFWKGACVAVAHQYLGAKGQSGFHFLADRAERIAQIERLSQLGAKVIGALKN